MGIEDKASRKFREIEGDAKKQHEQNVKNFLENFAKAKRIAEKARIVETLKGLEKAISRERGVQATQVWWTDKVVTYKQSAFSEHSIGHLEVTPQDSRIMIPKTFRGDGGPFFRAGLSWLRNKPGEEPQSQLISMIGASVDSVDQDDNIIVWPSTHALADYSDKLIDQDFGVGFIKVRTISPSKWKSSRILEDALIDSLTHPAQARV